jgi:hypothetical protein
MICLYLIFVLYNDLHLVNFIIFLDFTLNLYLYIYSSSLVPVILLVHTTYEDGRDRVFQNVGT